MSQRSPADLTEFGYLFPDLQEDPEALLPKDPKTLKALDDLGAIMVDTGNGDDSSIPAAYTYFGQFVDHDIVLEARSSEITSINSPDLEPLLLQQVFQGIKNTRSASLDLDSVYGHPALRQGDQLRVGEVSQAGSTLATQDLLHDLFRQGRMPDDPEHDREALIGDPRNDENLIVAQLHVAFLRAHNTLVTDEDKKMSFEEARRALRQHYQWIVIHDFLEQVADPEIARNTRAGNRFYQPLREPFFLPLEFTAAAFRFGHSMVRSQYNHNVSFPQAQLTELFAFTGRGGFRSRPDRPLPREPGVGFDTLPDAWIIDWSRFVGRRNDDNKARKIDTILADPLHELQAILGPLLQGEPRLAVRNLRRGYLLRMPTGQAVARKLGLEPLKPEQISEIVPTSQSTILEGAGLLERTPLWYYILAEAKQPNIDGNRLGPVGSTLVAEVLVGLVRRSTDSILAGDGSWKPSLGKVEGRFDLPDLLRFADVLPPEQPPVPPPT